MSLTLLSQFMIALSHNDEAFKSSLCISKGDIRLCEHTTKIIHNMYSVSYRNVIFSYFNIFNIFGKKYTHNNVLKYVSWDLSTWDYWHGKESK